MSKIAILALVLLGGCSVGMAVSGKPNPNLSAVHVGASRSEVELQLGSPVAVAAGSGKLVTNIYEYEIGNEPSGARAIGHGVMDFLTLGIWEVVGTPIEGFQGEKHRLTITYDATDHVTSVAP